MASVCFIFPTECRFVWCLPEFLHFQVCWLIYQTLCVWSSSRMETLIQTQGWWCRRKPAVTWSGEAKYVSDMYHIDNRIQNSNFTTQTENSSQFFLNTSQTWGQICIRYVSHSNIIHILKQNSSPQNNLFPEEKVKYVSNMHRNENRISYSSPGGRIQRPPWRGQICIRAITETKIQIQIK